MKHLLATMGLVFAASVSAMADAVKVVSPNEKLVVNVETVDGKAYYSATLGGKKMIERSLLGVTTDLADFTSDLSITKSETKKIDEQYTMDNAKASHIHYVANSTEITMENAAKQTMTVTFNVSDNDIAFRYSFPRYGGNIVLAIKNETTAFRFPEQTTTFLCPQNIPMTEWARAKPSYEEEYILDAPMTERSKFGVGYTFPCLFRVGNDGWALVSETGTNGTYVGCHLSDYNAATGYSIAFPQEMEANGAGRTWASVALPHSTPWRTITLGETLKPIVETTIAYDVVKPMYEPSQQYKRGRYVWSWLVWQDEGTNYDDQVQFIDMAAKMGYEYSLIDANWDVTIGYDRMKELSKYAQSKGVGLLLWYNSNGTSNDTPQTPMQVLNTSLKRNQEMQWMKDAGIKGIKVDFFGGDKQQTMQYYEDILADANRYGIQVIFHGCTLPRGWERMYPNYVSSEAVRASENVYFNDYCSVREPVELTIHPFCRNAFATMEYGGVIMNKYLARDNKSRHPRHTSDSFEFATGIINQSCMQCVAVYPNTIDEIPAFGIDFLKGLPAQWDETRFIDGYPGKYVVMARRNGNAWYVAALNAQDEVLKLELDLPMFDGKTVACYNDKPAKGGALPQPQLTQLKQGKNGRFNVTVQPNGGMVLK